MTAAAARPRRRRPWSVVLAKALLGCVAALLLLELGFRWFWTMPPHFAEFDQQGLYVATPDGGVGLQPGYRGTLRMEAGAPVTLVETNALGMRGPAVRGKQAGERRLIVVGDSLVFGYGVEGDEALPTRLQRELVALERPCTVGNGGVPTFGVSHAVAHMARLDAPFGADAFIVCTFLGNDAFDECKPVRAVYAGHLVHGDVARLIPVSWRARLAIRSRAALWLESWIQENHPEASPLTHVMPDPEEMQRMAGMPPYAQMHSGLFLDVIDERTTWRDGAPAVIPRVLAALRTALEKGKQIAGERPLWFVVLPTSCQVDEGRRVDTMQSIGFEAEKFERGLAQHRLLQVARELGITAFDATPILAAEKDHDGLFLADGGHLSVRGNQVVGRWLATEIAAVWK